MKTVQGNIWDFHNQGLPICITTNVGWKNNGENVMGRGVAQQAKEKFPGLTKWYGEKCRDLFLLNGTELGVVYNKEYNLICFPTKPLNSKQPWLSWQKNSTLGRIETSCKQLLKLQLNKVYLPVPGCGNGKLDFKDVAPILDKYLNTDNYNLVLFKKG